ncbi:MAG: hypothetical protein A2909_00985 [Candidatus Tagabacteria bacterium RIFCSPLOWO2_01_FULL_39_11]|uniref:Uncharacterized protein n=1 Tax=Candidatus Tagabacteria bacterium RIFCSPLOWO2_01_FULL_39_11 TaxID=1802295 RepID=A0A1G2LQI1_9BACT|nr:MAG: hypothetical protein A2909_00985 [Candidatus Tagabacteria bacterium RIFCSPLOWO2_01_FULL_39_11]
MNLLPTEDQIDFRKSYRKKIILIIGIFIIFTEIVFLILLLPSYIFLSSKKEAFNRELAIANQAPLFKRAEEIKSEMRDLNRKISLFSEQRNSVKDISVMLKDLIAAKPDGVSINFLDYKKSDRKDDKGAILVRGESGSRNIFLDFLEELKKKDYIMDLDSPVSNLLKEYNIKFFFTVFLSE